MDGDQDVADQLAKLLSQISSAFQRVVNEKNKINYEKEKSVQSIESLLAEITNLKKENELLRKTSNSLKPCSNCSELKKKLIIQNGKSRKLEMFLNMLSGEILNEVPYRSLSPSFKLLVSELKKLKTDELEQNVAELDNINESSDRYLVKENCYQPQKGRISDNFSSASKPANTNTQGRSEETSVRLADIEQLKERRTHTDAGAGSVINHYPDAFSSRAVEKKTSDEFRTPKKRDRCDSDLYIGSPASESKVKGLVERSPTLLVDPALLSRQSLASSPNHFKRKAFDVLSKSPGKKVGQKLLFQSPKQRKFMSPRKGAGLKSTSQSMNGSSNESQSSPSGARKLKQTQLNFEYYKSRVPERSNRSGEGATERGGKSIMSNDEVKCGEDDLILESPRHLPIAFNDLKKNDNERKCTEISIKEEQEQAFDPDETFFSSVILKESVKEEPKDVENEIEKSPKNYQSSPEYDTVPYLCKTSPVRKRSDRMKLPGQMCMDCNKYYKSIFGEIDPEKLQEILNRCSRHRNQHYNEQKTPPGYWTPYLTPATDSRDDDETFLDE